MSPPPLSVADNYHVGLVVPDMAAATASLTAASGYSWTKPVEATLAVTTSEGDYEVPFAFVYSMEAPHLEVIQEVPGTIWTSGPGGAAHHLGYWVDDLSSAAAGLEAVGYRQEARPAGPELSTFAYYLDPVGVRNRTGRSGDIPRLDRLSRDDEGVNVVTVTGPGASEVLDVPQPAAGPRDVLIRMRACGICGSDAFYITIGGIPPRRGCTPLGHEPAGEVVEVGADVTGITVGDHVVVNPMAAPSGIIGNGGATGALADYLLIEDAVRGVGLEVVPDHIPFEVAALNEPMAVARHGVNRCEPQPGDKVVVFGAGPVGLGAVLAFKSLGVSHVVVVDLIAARLAKALLIGADAVINSATEDAIARLIELHGEAESMFGGKSDTDVYLDAAGAKAVVDLALSVAKKGATLGIVGVHKEPVPVDLVTVMSGELTIVGSMGYPDEIFEVTADLVANWEKYALIVSHTVPFADVDEALRLASTPGAADKVVVTFD